MRRVLLTGMSGPGKSTLVEELAARGFRAVDADSPEWSEWAPYVAIPGVPEPDEPEQEWVWREDRIRELLAASPEGRLVFTSDYQFGPQVRRYRRPLTLETFWRRHSVKRRHANALYWIT